MANTAETRFVKPDEAARILGISRGMLATLRARGGGPAFSKPTARIVLYEVRNLEAWASFNRTSSAMRATPGRQRTKPGRIAEPRA